MSYLSIQGLHKRYGDTAIFSDINCEIAKGEFITLLGPSGCGKSTLLRCIAGLTGVNGGQILLDGEDLVPVAPQKRGIGMVFQSYALFPNMTVQQNVAFGLRMQKVKGSEAEQRVKEVLELVELNDFAGRYPQQLSGGQCQRVALARSLVTRPRLLLLDEPLSALDARIRKHLREQIRSIQQELGLTTIFVTHDQEEALVMSDRRCLCRRVYRQLQPARRRYRQSPAAAPGQQPRGNSPGGHPDWRPGQHRRADPQPSSARQRDPLPHRGARRRTAGGRAQPLPGGPARQRATHQPEH